MGEIEKIKNMLAGGKYREAAELINHLIEKNKENDELWYFLGIIALKFKNYDLADEYFERAFSLNRKAEYLKLRGMSYMEQLEIEAAIEVFEKMLELKDSVDANFFLSVCYLLLDDPQSEVFLKKAYKLDRRKTTQLLRNFFKTFLENSREISASLKENIKDELEELS